MSKQTLHINVNDRQVAEWIAAQALIYKNIEQMFEEFRELARHESAITEHHASEIVITANSLQKEQENLSIIERD